MAEKLKRYQALRQTEMARMKEIYDVAQKVEGNDDSFIPTFQCMFHNIEVIHKAFYDHHNNIVCLTATDETAFKTEDVARKEFDLLYYGIKVIKFKLPPASMSTSQSSAAVTQPSGKITSNQLPKITLPSFAGDITTFQSFIDMYDALIHNNNTLADCEKFTYLRSSLKGPGLAVIQHLPVTSSNYIIAYNTLCKRYKNTRLMASTLWNNLENAPKVVKDNPNDLRNLLDIFSENISALKNLGLPTDYWDFILVQMILKRLDIAIVTRFELFYDESTTLPTYKVLSEFLMKNCMALDNVVLPHNLSRHNTRLPPRKSDFTKPQPPRHTSLLGLAQESLDKTCPICKKSDHAIFKCPDFLAKTPYDRYQHSKTNKLCINCLSHTHRFATCQSETSCHKCNQKHHTLLHFSRNLPDTDSPGRQNPSNSSSQNLPSSRLPSVQGGFTSSKSSVLLSTARIEILDSRGTYQPVRCLLDTGSMTSFITSKCVNRLGLNPVQSTVMLNGLGSMNTMIDKGVTLSFRPFLQTSPVFCIDALILNKICDNLPTSRLPIENWPHLANLRLADDKFHIPASVDLLLGADIFPKIILDGSISVGLGAPDAINTIFGYILMGTVQRPVDLPSITAMFCHFDDSISLDNQVKQFWELEEVPYVKSLSPDEVQCEKIFADTYRRDDSGRFILNLPFKASNPTFPEMRSLALHRFYSLERRLLKYPQVYNQYRTFIQEYIDLDHMEPASDISAHSFYLPHHCVIKPDSLTTKLRVVFNGSAHLPNHSSLNDQLYIGPKLQNDIFTILLNFRIHQFVLTADITKMYRQIIINPAHQDYQLILWRFSPSEPVQAFRIKRLVYGLNCSPYLAIRTLHQLADEDGSLYPLAAEALRHSTYVDDIVAGSSTFESALDLQQQLISLLAQGGFELQKWSSNDPKLLEHLPSSSLAINPISFESSDPAEASLKVLGLEWNASSDSFRFCVKFPDKSCTKRNLLSNLARIFDPLGLAQPITFMLKHLIQRLWTLKLDWDQEPPNEIVRLWEKYVKDIACFSSFDLPRRIIPNATSHYELHCFGDASEKGFCSVLYCRCFSPSGNVSIHFLCSKAKIAPLKKISLPRLELCAGVLTSRLVSFVLKAFEGKLEFRRICCYSDSTVALTWIQSSPHKWRTFVSNRVAFIQEKLTSSNWFYIASSDNPADVGSRGMLPSELLNCSLWWAAPVLLNTNFPNSQLFDYSPNSEATSEERPLALSTFIAPNFLDMLIDSHSSITISSRILAYVLRFIFNCQNKTINHRTRSGFLTALDIHQALLVFVKRIQEIKFSLEISYLSLGKPLPKVFGKLSPFLDDKGILRVGGRLKNAPIHYESKFPALLPSRSRLTDLIIQSIHCKHLHAGVQTVHFLLLQNFWVLSAKRAIRRVLSRCVRCWKTCPTSVAPLMGNLPLPRVSRCKPFLHVGIDYAGPFTITLSKCRGSKTLKAYLCLFICLSVKAVHLEPVSDLSADAFLAAFKRFIGRRGRCAHVYSDCGTNFVKAQKLLDKYASEAAARETIDWHFNPPSSPHFGGLWEANIKSIKSHLSRMIGDHILTFEELSTIFIQVEAIMNSRPLTPISSDPNDLTALTPGHFLTLEPLTTLPETNLRDIPLNRLSRWQLLTRIHQHIWTRWSREYLHTLHQRAKWHTNSPNLQPGTLVAIKQDRTPPLTWPLGRIIETYPGTDGIVRVALVKTTNGVFKRPVVKLCPLPMELP